MKINKTYIAKFMLFSSGVILLFLTASLFIADVQKYLLRTQLKPWISDTQVDYIHITPFTIKINNLHFKYQNIDISIGHLDTEFSLFELFSKRIKIDKFVLQDTRINDQSISSEAARSSKFLFPGLFPYLDSGYIYDVGSLAIGLAYNSPATGPVELKAEASNINEQQSNPLNIYINAPELQHLPDIKRLTLNASVFLNQHLIRPVDRQKSSLQLQLETDEGIQQDIQLELAMEQLPRPAIWNSYPFDKRNRHYLTKILHPEKIQLNLTHSENETILSKLQFNGIYDGNEGNISGNIKLTTEKGFLALFKSLKLPEIISNLNAQFEYNTRTLDGIVDLEDQFKIKHYADDKQSLPNELDINNHLSMKLDGDFMNLNRFKLSIASKEKEYIKLITYKPLLINLSNIYTLLDQQQSDLLSIKINQLPLDWFNDFIPDYKVLQGIADTDINLSVANRSLVLETKRPFSLKNVNIIQQIDTREKTPPASDTDHNIQTSNIKKTNLKTLTMLNHQYLETDFILTISDKDLKASLNKLELFQSLPSAKQNSIQKPVQQLSSSIQFNLDAPLSAEFMNKPLTLSGKGTLNIQELIKIPLVEKILAARVSSPLSKTLPKQFTLNYELALKSDNKLITLDKINIDIKSHKLPHILSINNLKSIQLKRTPDQFLITTTEKLLSARINHFDFKWLAPLTSQYSLPYTVSGILSKLDTTISRDNSDHYQIDINKLFFSDLQLREDKQLLFNRLNLSFKSQINYSADKISIIYPNLNITQSTANGNNSLLTNNGSIVLTQMDQKSPQIFLKGKLKGYVNRLMNIGLINQFTHKTLSHSSVLNSQYQLRLKDQVINVSALQISVFHPHSKGRLDIKTHNPIKFSLTDHKQSFAQNGHITFKLTNFDIKPYEVLFPDIPITFDQASTRISLTQKNKKQTLKFDQPLVLHNIHYKNKKKALLKPFNFTLNAQLKQSGTITEARIHQLSVQFLGQKNKALNLTTQFKLNSIKSVPVTNLKGHLNVLLTQWLNQPGIMPHNTLTEGSLTADISMDKNNKISHKWLINDLTDHNGDKIIKSITINGKGETRKINDIFLNFPLIMQSQSGTTELQLTSHLQLKNKQPEMALTLHGKEIYLNDLLKLMAAINPDSEISKLEKEKDTKNSDDKSKGIKAAKIIPDNTPAASPFWPTGIDILADLDIKKLYYSDYMSYHDIKGRINMNKDHFVANNMEIIFHKSPMNLSAEFTFKPKKKQPYDIQLHTALSNFYIGGFLKELKPDHVPRADGVFDVDVKFYGPLSNLTQIRNELMFNIDISGVDGVYHLIPSNNLMLRSSGQAMALLGEVVSVLPTSGFGLGIINRVVRFAKDINYDLIRLSMSRQSDLNTRINQFEILSPELYLYADGEITFKENTRLFDQDLKMQAHLDLAGEGAAIFYGLGLLQEQQDEYGFWKGPEIKFWGSLSNQQDNFDEIINKAKEGTLAGGITNPFSGLVGNFKYRWTGHKPDYSKELEKYTRPEQTPVTAH